MTEEELLEIEKRALPTYGTCAMLGTANSMSCLAEILGLALPHSCTALAVSAEKRRFAKQSGKRAVELIKEGLTARKILTRGGAAKWNQRRDGHGGVDQYGPPSDVDCQRGGG